MIEINGYQLYEEQSSPIRTVYKGHHKTRQPHRSCTVEAIFEEDVPQCYRQLLKYSNYYITEPQILLRHIFTSPQHPHHIFFVQYEPNTFRNHLELNLQNRFLSVFQMIRTVFWIFKRGLIHDFQLENVALGKDATYFCNFVINGKEKTGLSQINRRVELIIPQLLQNQEENLGTFEVDINDDLGSVSLEWRKKMGRGEVNMLYCFKCNLAGEEVISITSKQSLDCLVISTWQKQVVARQLKAFIPSYDLSSTKWHIPSIAEKKLVECGLQVDEFGGIFGDQVKIKEDIYKDYPYNTVGLITAKMKGKKHGQMKDNFGTAVLIGEDLIMTCAHNILCYKSKQEKQEDFYEAQPKDMVFVHNKISYKIQDIRFPKQYEKNIYSKDRYKYDYALLKLKLEEGQKIDIKLFSEMVHNYKEKELGLKIKGFYGRKQLEQQGQEKKENKDNQDIKKEMSKDQNRKNQKDGKEGKAINSRLAQATLRKFIDECNQIYYEYDSKEKGSEGGFSGGPIFIILAELDYGFKYHLMIGIHNSGHQGQNGNAIFFTQEIINQFAQWQQQLTPGGKRFKNILDFSKITNLDQVCKGMRDRLDDIVFNPIEKEYLPKLFEQVKNQKQTNSNYIEKMYINLLPQNQSYGEKANQVLLDMGSFNKQLRHNNIIFMYHLRNYENWFAPWQAFGQSQGLTVFYIYIVLQLEFFFTKAKVSQEKEQSFKRFQEFLTKQVEESYHTRGYSKQAAFNVNMRLYQLQYWLKSISINNNFRKMLFIEVEFMKCLYKLFCQYKRDVKLFEVSKICVLGFLAKEFFTKVVEVDNHLKHYLFVFNEIILICMKYLLEEEMFLEAREAKFSFAWSVRMLIKDHPSLRQDFLRFDPNHQVFMSKQQREERKQIEEMMKRHIFGEQVRSFLRNCMTMVFQ